MSVVRNDSSTSVKQKELIIQVDYGILVTGNLTVQ